MSMWFSRNQNGFLGWFSVVRANGVLATGLAPGSFTVTVVTPDDSASSTFAVAESTQKPGLYTFEVTSAFVLANGIGNYGVVVEVSAGNLRDAFGSVLLVSRQDFTSLGNLGNAILGNVV